MLDSTLPTSRQVVHSLSLHYGAARTPLVRVVPDVVFPDMWRMAWPDGRLSDMASLIRIKDAAERICVAGPPERDPRRLCWRYDRSDSLREARTRAQLISAGGDAHRRGYRAPESKPGKMVWDAKASDDNPPRPNELDGFYTGARNGARVAAEPELLKEGN